MDDLKLRRLGAHLHAEIDDAVGMILRGAKRVDLDGATVYRVGKILRIDIQIDDKERA